MRRVDPFASHASGRDRLRLAVVGDVHLCWDEADVRYFDESDYDAVLFVGDLCGYRQRPGLRVARAIAAMRVPTLVMPGNHDGVHLLHLAAEVFGWRRLAKGLGGGQRRRVRRMERALGSATVCGYSLHPTGAGVTIVAARPHAMGGPHLPFGRHLRRAYGVGSLAESAEELRALVDRVRDDRIVFLAHNGPTGLGDRRHAPFGCDFRPEEGDWGDPDLREAVDYAKASGRRVLAVVAGHMHHALQGGGTRTWQVETDGSLYVNAARVPRILEREGRRLHHHVRLEIDAHGVRAREMWIGLARPGDRGGLGRPPPAKGGSFRAGPLEEGAPRILACLAEGVVVHRKDPTVSSWPPPWGPSRALDRRARTGRPGSPASPGGPVASATAGRPGASAKGAESGSSPPSAAPVETPPVAADSPSQGRARGP